MTAVPSPKNAWRSRSEGAKDWAQKLRPGAADKYFVVTADAHINEPMNFLSARVDPKYHDRLPHVRTDEDGTQWLISEGWGPQPVRVAANRRDLLPTAEEFESWEVLTP